MLLPQLSGTPSFSGGAPVEEAHTHAAVPSVPLWPLRGEGVVVARFQLTPGPSVVGCAAQVMVLFKADDVGTAMELGREAAAEVSRTFVSPIKLEFEKVYNPYLLISKKRYAGLLWTRPEKWDKIDTKGIETVRRDNCLLVRNVIKTCLDQILVGRDPKGAAEYVKGVISDLLMNKLDLSLLVISKARLRHPPPARRSA